MEGNIVNVVTTIWKGGYSKRNEFASQGSKFFPFRVATFLDGIWCA